MEKKDFERINKEAKERFKNYTTIENLLFISDILTLESEKRKKSEQKIAVNLEFYAYKIALLINDLTEVESCQE